MPFAWTGRHIIARCTIPVWLLAKDIFNRSLTGRLRALAVHTHQYQSSNGEYSHGNRKLFRFFSLARCRSRSIARCWEGRVLCRCERARASPSMTERPWTCLFKRAKTLSDTRPHTSCITMSAVTYSPHLLSSKSIFKRVSSSTYFFTVCRGSISRRRRRHFHSTNFTDRRKRSHTRWRS